uniref:Uncharacterized protein LOC114326048 n=1 Tax=Diabrotica virgifera virgifera TaxID=50390 RepID=A0A6P7F583_DIAVI
MDGTFDYCTFFFLQMFTLHTLINDTYVPVAFCLLPNKQKFTYKSLFELLKKKCQDLGCNLNPTKIVIDYELGIHSSMREVFPEANVVGCRFHLAQAWWRKVQNVGLSSEYKNENSEIGKWLKHIFGLMYLTPSQVGDCFVEDFMPEKPDLVETSGSRV